MTREYGAEYPERPLMSTLSDLLRIEHFSTSRGSTVRRDFLEAVAEGLGVDPSGLDKDGLIRLLWETARHERMPNDRLSIGGTVTNRVLQDIVDGILEHGTPWAPPAPGPEPEQEVLWDESDSDLEFDPADFEDERNRRLVEQAQREGQDQFRTKVLDAYGGECAVTGTQVPMVLQAAHIAPYRGPEFNVVANGLCLRADIHVLFDRGAIAIHEDTFRVLVQPHLEGSHYRDLEGTTIIAPRARRERPSRRALAAHRQWAGLFH